MFSTLQVVPEDIVHHIDMIQGMHHIAKTGRPRPQGFTGRQRHHGVKGQRIRPRFVTYQHFQRIDDRRRLSDISFDGGIVLWHRKHTVHSLSSDENRYSVQPHTVRRRVLRRANPLQPPFDLNARIAAHPNPATLVAGDMHVPVAPTTAALSGNISAADHAACEQPLGQGGIETAGDRIFDDSAKMIAQKARTSKAASPSACGPTTPMSTLRGQLLAGVRKVPARRWPAGSPATPGHYRSRRHRAPHQTRSPKTATSRPTSLLTAPRNESTVARQTQPPSLATNAHQSCSALLDDLRLVAGRPSQSEPGMAAAQRRVPGKRHFTIQREYSHPVIRLRVRRRQ